MNISFIGAGNVAWHLTQKLENAGHSIIDVFSRDIQNAKSLAAQLYDTDVKHDLNYSESPSQVFVIAVKDSALEEVVERLVLPENAILVNTSGTLPLETLEKLVEVYSDVPVCTGVFYPLQTFTREEPLASGEIPFCIEASDQQTAEKLVSLAQSISRNVYEIDSEERKILHIAAVFANNFTNHLLSVSADVLEREGLDFEMLGPLITETYRKALAAGDPSFVQTGPARRGDWETTNNHLAYLQAASPEWAKLYRTISESIREKHFGEDE